MRSGSPPQPTLTGGLWFAFGLLPSIPHQSYLQEGKMSNQNTQRLLKILADSSGFDDEDEFVYNQSNCYDEGDCVKGMCVDEDCGHIVDAVDNIEEVHEECPCCGQQTIQSSLRLAGLDF